MPGSPRFQLGSDQFLTTSWAVGIAIAHPKPRLIWPSNPLRSNGESLCQDAPSPLSIRAPSAVHCQSPSLGVPNLNGSSHPHKAHPISKKCSISFRRCRAGVSGLGMAQRFHGNSWSFQTSLAYKHESERKEVRSLPKEN